MEWVRIGAAVDVISLVVSLVAAMAHPVAQPSMPPVPVPTPIGTGRRYRLPAHGPATAAGRPVAGLACARAPGTADTGVAHVEVFARGRVLLIPPAVGVVEPRLDGATVTGGSCRYPLWTDDPTGVVHFRHGARATLGSLFAVWSQPLGAGRLCGFRSRRSTVAYVNGVRWRGRVGEVPLHEGDEIVVEIGRRIAPHATYLFPGGPV
jgi:hypothetical protein